MRGADILGKESLSKYNEILSILLVAGEDRDPSALITSADVTDRREKQTAEDNYYLILAIVKLSHCST